MSLHYLTNFRLKSTQRLWELEELLIILGHLPNVQSLSVFLSTSDLNLVYGNMLLPLLPAAVQQFNYAIYYFPSPKLDRDNEIVASWPLSLPIACFSGNNYWFIHTLPWHLDRMSVLPSFGKTISSERNHKANYDRYVKHLEIFSDNNFTLVKSLGVVAQCRRMKTLKIRTNTTGEAVEGMNIHQIRSDANMLENFYNFHSVSLLFFKSEDTIR
jgi:hypothetical protein